MLIKPNCLSSYPHWKTCKT